MSTVEALPRGVAELVVLIALGLLLALVYRIAWRLFGFWAPHLAEPAVRKLRALLAPLGPLAQTLLCVMTVLVTALILRVPDAGPWASIMAGEHGDGLSTSMLAGAAALLVLLNFAGSRARWAEEDARDSATYMGQVLTTFRFLNSPWTALTRQRAFHILVIALFVVPLLLTVVPYGPATPWAGVLSGDTVSPRDLLAALWCAAFAIVGSTLIMHLAGSLRISMPDTTFVQQLIRWDLEDESRAEWSELLRASAAKEPPSRILHEWVQRHLSVAWALPVSEREGYLRATVCQHGLLAHSASMLDRAVRKLEGADLADPEASDGRSDGGLRTEWHTWPRVLQVTRRRVRAEAMVSAVDRGHSALIDAFTDGLTTLSEEGEGAGVDTESIAELLSRDIVRSGRAIDAAHTKLSLIGASTLAESLLTPSAMLPDRTFLRSRPWHGDAGTPKVLTLTATGFRDLSRAAYYPWSRKQPPLPLGLSLADLIESAQGISHRPTRDHVLDDIVMHFLRGVVIGSSPVEVPDALEDIWARRRRISDGSSDQLTAEDPLAELIESRTFTELTHQSGLSPAATGHLLSVLPGWRAPCALLHALLYARRSHRTLSTAQLAPYAAAMRSTTPLTPDALDALRVNALAIIRDPAYNTSHFTSDEGVTWLVRSLGERLTPDLCIEFARRRESFQILELRLLDFVQWHLIAGVGFGAPSRDVHDPDLLTPATRDSAGALWEFCRSWEGVHSSQARELRIWLRYVVGPEPDRRTSSRYTWAVRTRLAGMGSAG